MTTEARVASQHPQINQSMILRGGEYFNRKIGFGFYENGILERLYAQELPHEENTIWLPAETAKICDVIDSGKGVLIEGGLGSGKSALMYGIRATYRKTNRPYALIDGHYMNAPVAKIDSVFSWAERNDALLLWDSFDYLPSRSRKVRKGPIEAHTQRTNVILTRTVDYIDSGGKFVATSHTQPWLDKYGDPSILNGAWTDVMARLHRHSVIGKFDRPEELVQFYKIAGFPDEAIRCITSITTKDIEVAALAIGLPESEIPDLTKSLSSYRIAKLLALDPTGTETREAISMGCNDPSNRDSILLQVAQFIYDSNLETKKRMGADSIEP